jgi:hypothetical protein
MALTAKQKRDARDQKLRDEGAASARAEQQAPNADLNGGVSREIADINLRSATNPGAVQNAHGEIARPQSAGAKVIVACKLGVAYYAIQLCRIDEKFEQNMQGGRTVKEATRIGQVINLRGTAYPRGTPPVGFPAPPQIVNGAALNYGIDKDWFDAWLEQHKLDPLVMNKLIFAHETVDGVTGEAKELANFLSGLEPVDPRPGKDARMPKSSRPSEVTDIEGGQRGSST